MNKDEILFHQLLLAEPADSVTELEKWAAATRAEHASAGQQEKQGCSAISASCPRFGGGKQAFVRLHDAFYRNFSDGELDRIAAAMATLAGHKKLSSVQLRAYIKAVKTEKAFGPRANSKARKRPRWESAQLAEIADGVARRGPQLRRALRGEEEQHLTTEEQLDAALELNEELLEENAELTEERRLLLNTNRQQRKRAGEHVAAKAKARRTVREAEREKAAEAEKVARSEAEAQAAEEHAATISELEAAVSNAEKRAKKRESQAQLAQSRLRRAQIAEAKVNELSEQLDEMQPAEDETESEDEEAPTRGRRDAKGHFAELPWRMRELIYAEEARRTPPTAIAANISDVLRLFASEEVIPMPCVREMQRMRHELTVAGECLAAFRVALCKRIISFGFDESTKFGLGLLSSSTQIEPHDAPGTTVDVVLRGRSLCRSPVSIYIYVSITVLRGR